MADIHRWNRPRDKTLKVIVDTAEPAEVPGLAPDVVGRVLAELDERGGKVVRCLQTAAALLEQAREDVDELRLAESAAYNLRQAFDAVVEDQAVPPGALNEVTDAWKRYEIAVETPSENVELVRAELDAVLRRVAADEERKGLRLRQLLAFIRQRTGLEPLPGEGNPTQVYNQLRDKAAKILHTDGTVAGVSALYEQAVDWFARFFAPPDYRVLEIVDLAERPFADGLVVDVRRFGFDAHDLRLFLSRLRDPEWLVPLYEAKLIPLPAAGERWPLRVLTTEAGEIDREPIAELLLRIFQDSRSHPEPQRSYIDEEILLAASGLGPPGYPVAEKIIARRSDSRWIRTIAVSIAEKADPTDRIQLIISRAVVGNEPDSDRGYHSREVLERLAAGITADNVIDRMKMLAGKVRHLAAMDLIGHVVVDPAALPSPGELDEPVLIAAQHLTRLIPTARDRGLSTSDLLGMVSPIPGDLGERLVCRVLTGAEDVERAVKVKHIAQRLSSHRATGDDRDLINDILTTPLAPGELDIWRTALGQPSAPPDTDGGRDMFGGNWPQGWRWSLVLPSEVLDGWEDAIAAVTACHGEPTPASLDTRTPRSWSGTTQSPHSAEEIAALTVDEAAERIAAWRPSDADGWRVNARELARVLEATVKDSPQAWTNDPTTVVSTLREPVYINHYFRAITKRAADLADRAPALLAAVGEIRAQRWEPTTIGRGNYDYEPDWTGVDIGALDMIAALANHDADLTADLDLCWEIATEQFHLLPDSFPDLDDQPAARSDAPLNRAINQQYGKALEAALWLSAWEHRNQGRSSDRLVQVLDEVLAIPGSVGLELRAVLASRRPVLEVIAADWLGAGAETLFSRDPLGAAAFDQTVLWSRNTAWFYSRYQARLIEAARRGAENATSSLLVAMLHGEAGYTFAALVKGLRSNSAAWKEAADRMAALMQGIEADDPMAKRGLQFWDDMLAADRQAIPTDALEGLGRWTFVRAIDDAQFLERMDRTLDITGGSITMAIEIADRCKDAQPSALGLRILRTMIGHGEPWQQHHIERAGVEALALASAHSDPTDSFEELRDRLIQRGQHEAAYIRQVR